jgi:hypothetical protein
LTSRPTESSSLGMSSSMKSPFPLPSAMVLAFQQIFSSLRMILVIVHSPLLGQCTSFCLQALPPASPMSPAPLHVPLRLCLGRPHLRPMTLPPHQCLHSTSPLRCGPWGHLPGRSLSRSLPRHARPRRRPARPEHPPRPTSRLLCVRARPRRRPARPEHPPQPTFPLLFAQAPGFHLGSCPCARNVASRSTTPGGPLLLRLPRLPCQRVLLLSFW